MIVKYQIVGKKFERGKYKFIETKPKETKKKFLDYYESNKYSVYNNLDIYIISIQDIKYC